MLKEKPKTPYLKTEKKCFICSSKTTQVFIKPYCYKIEKKDVDNYPKEIRYFKEEVKGYNPRFYFMTHCFGCNFTSARQLFEYPIPKYSITKDSFIKKFLNDQKKSKVKAVTSLLKKDIVTWKEFIENGDSKDYLSLFQAIKLHLLAIFQLLQYPKTIVNKDATELGTYILHLGWLYRDAKEDKETQSKLSELFKNLKAHWEDVPTTYEMALEQSMQFYDVALINSRTISTTQREIAVRVQILRIKLKLGENKEAYKILLDCVGKAKKFDAKKDEYVSMIKQETEKHKTNVIDLDDKEKEFYFKQINDFEKNKALAEQMVQDSKTINLVLNEVKDIFDDIDKQDLK